MMKDFGLLIFQKFNQQVGFVFENNVFAKF